ncbi:MAG: fluoride efflux transporter CrcB [Woeseiaceae bacterium]|nr:fluoride efflux transporter CrcB [Woeseiaceae bacterium]
MRVVLWSYGFVAIGGALGAMARFGLNVLMQRDIAFPWGTLAANLLGCLVMGMVAQLVATSTWFNEAGIVPDQYRLLFAIGFCGSFTTLSALVMEMHTMLQRNELLSAFSYLMATMIGGFAFFYAGFMLLRLLRGSP